MIIDEIGYLPLSRTRAMLFFQLMSRRYEHASTLLTSNKGFEDWGEVFGDDECDVQFFKRRRSKG